MRSSTSFIDRFVGSLAIGRRTLVVGGSVGPGSSQRARGRQAAPVPCSRPQPRLVRAGVVGLAAGFLSGLFGVGGGILIVPALVLLLHMGQRLAHGTSLAAVLPIAVSGVIGFAVEDSVDWPVALAIAVGAMVGAVIGTHWLQVLPARVLAYAFAVVLLASAIRLVLDDADAAGRDELGVLAVIGLVVVGVLSGTLAGLLGVGGGVVMVPAQIIAFSIPAAVAKGTSLAVIIPTSVVATARNSKKANADLGTAAVVGLAGVVSAFGASQISVGLDERLSNALFALLLAFVAVRMLVTAGRG
jgi:hypothetical protein